jgi:hypothetical protein
MKKHFLILNLKPKITAKVEPAAKKMCPSQRGNIHYQDRKNRAHSQKEGVDVDSSESKGVTNGGNGHKSHSPPAEKRIAEESTVRYL